MMTHLSAISLSANSVGVTEERNAPKAGLMGWHSHRSFSIGNGSLAFVLAAIFGLVGCSRQPLRPVEVAKLVAVPLQVEGVPESNFDTPQLLANISTRINTADALGQRKSDLAPIAKDYADSLRALRQLIEEAPSAQPLIRAGIQTWRDSLDNDEGGFLFGLLGVGSELSKVKEFSEKVDRVHDRVLACRLQARDAVLSSAQPESRAITCQFRFTEVAAYNNVASDTLSLTNVSGQKLTDVVAIVELKNDSGESFSNLFYAKKWEPAQTLVAICPSGPPWRETVHRVSRVRVRVVCNERTSRLADFGTRN
jgi:hypothetical protein